MIWVFDLCGTLYRENTTFAFVESVDGAGLDWRRAYVRRRRFPPLRVFNRVLSTAGLDVCRVLAARMHQGAQRGSLEASTRAILPGLTPVPTTHRLLEACRQRGDTLVLATASFDFIAKPIGETLGFRHVVSTELAWDAQGRCLGSIDRDLLGRKWAAIEPLVRGEAFEVVTDNLDDIDLVRRASRAHVISRRRDAGYWASVRADVIDWID
jgi:phosphoserine phosphatase